MAFVALTTAETDPNSPGTTDLFTKIKDNFDDLDSRSRSLQVVEQKEVSADATSVTFSGLDGNTDFMYRLVGRIVKSSGTPEYTIEPNAIAPLAATHRSLLFSVSPSTTAFATRATIFISDSISSERLIMFDFTFIARIQVQTVDSFRLFQGNSFRIAPDLAGPSSNNVWGIWKDDSTNITSLKIVSSVASEIRKGSHLTLYKLKPT